MTMAKNKLKRTRLQIPDELMHEPGYNQSIWLAWQQHCPADHSH
jgi:hypothetical protein